MRRTAITIACLAASLATLSAVAAPAFAESAWWHLTSGARPTYLHVGGGQPEVPAKPAANEVQKVTVTATGGRFVLANMTKEEVEKALKGEGVNFECESGEPKYAESEFNASAAEVQKGLERVCGYGAGNIEVNEEAGGTPEAHTYAIAFKGALAEQPVRLVNTEIEGEKEGPDPIKGTIKAAEATVGHPPVAPVPSTDGEIYVTAENLGDRNAEGETKPIQFKDILPANLEAVEIAGTQPQVAGDFQERRPIPCDKATLTCTLNGPLAPYDTIEMKIAVRLKPGAHTGESNQASISGGAAPATSVEKPITVSSEPVPFGLEDYEMALEEEGGAPVVQAGKHPFQFTTSIGFNQLKDINPFITPDFRPEVTTPALAKDLHVKLPPGLIGNPTPIAQCTTAEFFLTTESGAANSCPNDTAIGVATVTVHEPVVVGTSTITQPIFNLEPRVGEPARFGFDVTIANSPVFIDTAVGSGGDYAVSADVSNITQNAAFISSAVTFWGVPGDARHDRQRGYSCLLEARNSAHEELPACDATTTTHPPPFLSLPTRCNAPLQTSMTFASWEQPSNLLEAKGIFDPAETLTGCSRLQFQPQIVVKPDGQEASKPTGLTVDVHVPQEVNTNAEGYASSNVKDISVTFPEGMVLNPAAADGLQACSEALAGFQGFGELEPGTQTPLFSAKFPQPLQQGSNFCPDAAKVGTAKIVSPLLPKGQYVEGSLYLAAPAPNEEAGNNPFKALVAMYILAEDPVSGTVVKLPGKVTLDERTGRITASFQDNPQLAFEDAEIHLFGGERAPLATPATCGTKTTEATFTPWSGTGAVHSTSSFNITSGPGGGPCPGASLPFAPTFAAGTTSNSAGSFSSLTTTISRQDGNQDINKVQLHMPPGLSGVLTGVPLCPEAQANAGTCSQASRIGTTVVSVGLGGDPFSVTGGEVFLTEKYAGAPFGLSIVNPAVAGPFDLGKVIVRATIQVDPRTAQLTITTGQIPHILKGIPLQIKHVNVLVDRPGFTFNPQLQPDGDHRRHR
jgi:hypothetical protein